MLLSVIRVNVDESLTQVGHEYGTVSIGEMTFEQFREVLDALRAIPLEEAEKGPPGLMVTGTFGRYHIKVEGDFITYSNPENLNQQNVRVGPDNLEELFGFAEKTKAKPVDASHLIVPRGEAELRANRKQRMEFAVMVVVAVIAIVAAAFTFTQLAESGHEPPGYVEIDNPLLLDLLKEEYAGDYVSQGLGESLLKLYPEGRLEIYTRTMAGDVFSDPEESHTYRFVRVHGKKAMLLNEEQAMVDLEEAALVFFGRRYINLRNPLPETQLGGLIR